MKNARPFAVFDIDGTLIRWQLYHAVVDHLANQGLLGKQAREVIHKERMVWKRREHPEAFKQYDEALIKVYEDALPNLDPSVFDATVRKVVEEYKTQVYTYTRGLAASLKARGYFLLAISGSHQELVESVAKQYGFDDWVGSEYERKDNQFTTKKFVGSKDKQHILQTLMKQHNLILSGSIGVGDSKSDAAFLEIVEQPVAFNPDRELLQIAKQNGWDIVIERKNVVYELRERDGSYLLA